MQDDRAAAMDGLRALTDWAAGMSPDRIPPAMLARAAAVLADDFGAIVAASSEPEVARFHAMTLDRRADAEATVFRGGRSRTGRQNAAVANGLAACWLELDEGYRKASCHAGLYIVPALLAEAEATHMPVIEVLRTLVLAYEIVTRFAMTWNSPGRHVHSHAQFCAVGAAAAVALARRLPADELRNVLAMASTLVTVGPRNHVVHGALVRNAWSAAGAWSGMMCVDWAACGLNGSADAPHDVFGTIFQAPTEAECLSAGLGESWAVQDGYTKLYACCQYTHSVAEAALSLRHEIGEPALAGLAAIDVETHPLAVDLKNANPDTTLAAKFSVPHVVATALVSGSAGADGFRSDTMNAPDIVRLRPMVTVRLLQPDLPPPNDRASRVSVTLRDGRTVSRECLSAVGSPDRPMDRATLLQKLSDNTAARYPNATPVLERLMRLDPQYCTHGFRALLDAVCAD
jgi:2-methylcitrate dehydratase PrpD